MPGSGRRGRSRRWRLLRCGWFAGVPDSASEVLAAPDDRGAHAARAHVCQARRDTDTSPMAKGIFGYKAGESLDRSAD